MNVGVNVGVSVDVAVGVIVSVSVGVGVDVCVAVEVAVGVIVSVSVGVEVAVPRKPRKGGKTPGNAQPARSPRTISKTIILLKCITLSNRYQPSYWRIL